ncbi:MAG: PEP-CTERM sorting domain-containing protein [Planctomycetota bacterium]
MKRLIPILLVMSVAGVTMAGINTDKALGPLELYVYPDGTAEIVNTGDSPFTFDGYAIASSEGLIDSVAWTSIPQNVEAGMDPAIVGQTMLQAFSWAEMARTFELLSEAHLSSAATLQPDGRIPMGAAFPDGLNYGDLYWSPYYTLTYVDSATQASYEGTLIPEPASLSLLGLGALALIRRRR